jgi:DNA helicase-2/ATP-dependent DNA helicase PcrA
LNLNELNPQQVKAVTHPGGPLLVLAGAGSGKTRVLTYRVAYLVRQLGVDPNSIMAITFTNKAANEMKERLKELLSGYFGVFVSTFHSACLHILRRDIDKLGYERGFAIFDTYDQKIVVRDCLKELNLSEKKFPPNSALSYIGREKDHLHTPKDSLDMSKNVFEKTMAQIYELYQKKLYDSNALDFDDMIFKTVELFRLYPRVLSYYQETLSHILIDEYQDTNRAQYELIKMLAEKHRNICAVGDDDQSIYGFRGADIRNILDFERDFPDATVIRLEQNYRSTQIILDAANSVIENNTGRKKKRLWTSNPRGVKIGVATLQNEKEEALFIAKKIQYIMDEEGLGYGNFAVLYRTNAQSRVLEETMLRSGIPYSLVGSIRFYHRKEVKDILAYLRIVVNSSDNVSLERIINVPKRGIGNTTVDKLKTFAQENNRPIYEIIKNIEHFPFSSLAKNRLNKFKSLIDEIVGQSQFMNISDLVRLILEKTGYLDKLYAENTVEAASRIENLKELVSAASEFESQSENVGLEDFLADIALSSEVDELAEDEQAVVLMTLHSAKGLEFPVVFIAGMEEGIFPHARSMFDPEQLEEERRLCYVGMTRAKMKLFLTRALQRNVYGSRSVYSTSRFLGELPMELIEEEADQNIYSYMPYDESTQYLERDFSEATQDKIVRDKIGKNSLMPGDMVKHTKWGKGLVLDIEGNGENAQVSIDFALVGVKHLILKYAPIVKI